ncbi:hypothetical protein Pyn_21017 [Prunus yedoensis var. nudiflora]|uniref:Uncharacterized protein n=1 Tax=Prunus yedoensis var. nudiflora TaxID=2094558 RepID=A0A315B431_PRUYE|nr:hypothetical protein Pyn_21017 [Prunus yedoensis var. nudiflora]
MTCGGLQASSAQPSDWLDNTYHGLTIPHHLSLWSFVVFSRVHRLQAHPTPPPRHPRVQTFISAMGFVVVVSVPVILFIVIIALAFYLIGRATGRREAFSAPHHFGPPVPPPPQAQEKSDQV